MRKIPALTESVSCRCNETPEARCFIKISLLHSQFLGLMRTFWPYHRMADGIVVGVCATGSDHVTRQEASEQEGASLAHKNLLSIPQELLWLENKDQRLTHQDQSVEEVTLQRTTGSLLSPELHLMNTAWERKAQRRKVRSGDYVKSSKGYWWSWALTTPSSAHQRDPFSGTAFSFLISCLHFCFWPYVPVQSFALGHQDMRACDPVP